ncbi:hypothetical protein BAJUN_00950 [Bajunvirus bajun]|uniref:Uncharacterized protein n=1 Tax=Brevundimonas phage vB_BgoS-Bajun TaxID=2948594 RepID=A0A9E7N674_9CAUD|nr:hypothetical protein BAJUN_00950 [Brevundimonas phage vB_BgoS-Bajun]
MNGAVTYAVTPYAYKVQVWRNTPTGAELVEEYTGGNSTLDSQAFVPLTALTCETPEAMGRYALSTAQEMATKHGIDHYDIGRDEDEEAALLEAYGPKEAA